MVFYRKDKPEPNAWVRWFVNRTMVKNNNNLVSVVGKTGSGKTWSAISICELMSKQDGVPFTIDHIVFSLTELMELINSGKLIRGSKIVFDEPQCSISARDFQSEANKGFNYLLTTFRHRNLSLFFCTPFESLLDKSTRKLFHVKIETHKIDLKNKTCIVNARYLEYTDYKTEPYRKRLVVNTMKGSQKVTSWSVPKPSMNLIEQYEKKKLEFTTNLNKNLTTRLQNYEEKGKGVTRVAEGVIIKSVSIAPKPEEVISNLLNKNPNLSTKEIKYLTNYPQHIVYYVMNKLKRRNFLINSIEKPEISQNLVEISPETT